MSHWVSGFEEETSATGHEGLDQSSEGWLADCFNNDEMHCSPDDLNLSGPSDVQIDISECSWFSFIPSESSPPPWKSAQLQCRRLVYDKILH
ncbi:protein XRI1-like [Camellia sinensis]|uniref:protein XRI1-like n=1 Tax=Camellia sinensis TaxID=4442 RepID=UPI0010359150|nr:protein XRI1-like [Camellia sinensis]